MVRGVQMKLYVEGGGDANSLKTACREGFSTFLKKAGLAGQMPRVVACGSRTNAYDSFCTAMRNGEPAMLLVDSEAQVSEEASYAENAEIWKPWLHLSTREGDGWSMPDKSKDIHCHLMVQCMEAWFLADPQTLAKYFGRGFQLNALPATHEGIEGIPKHQVYKALTAATRNSVTKGAYSKGDHSFKLLALIQPDKVIETSPWAKRFIDALKCSSTHH